MSHETSPSSDPYGEPNASYSEVAARPEETRFQKALQNPELRQRAQNIGKSIGREALRSAVEGTGVIRVGKNGNNELSGFGVAKAVLFPASTLRKAAQGGLKGGIDGARHGAVQEARSLVGNALSNQGWSTPNNTNESTTSLSAAPVSESVYGNYDGSANSQNGIRAAEVVDPYSPAGLRQENYFGAPTQPDIYGVAPLATAQVNPGYDPYGPSAANQLPSINQAGGGDQFGSVNGNWQ